MYRINAKLRAAIVGYLYDKLRVDMERDQSVGLELLELDYVGRLPGLPHGLPLSARVKGPSNLVDNALSYLQQLVKESEEEIVKNLKDLDDSEGAMFRDIRVIAGTYDLRDIVKGEWTSPPSTSPTAEPEPESELETETEMVVEADIPKAEEMITDVPWWVWVIVALAILSCCSCVCFCILYRSWRKSQEKQVEIKRQYDVPMRNRRRRSLRLSSFNETEGTKRKRRPPRSKRSVHSKRRAHTKRSRKEGFEPSEEHAIVPIDPLRGRRACSRVPTFYRKPEGNMAGDLMMGEVRSKHEETRRVRAAKRARVSARDKSELGSMDLPDPQEERYQENQAYYYQERHFLEPGEFQVDEEGYGGHKASYHSEKVFSDPKGFLSDDLKSVKRKKKSKKNRKMRGTPPLVPKQMTRARERGPVRLGQDGFDV